MGHPAFVGELNPKKVTASQDDDSVVGIKNIGSSAKNTKRSKSHKFFRMTILCEN
jgi:hypothetical protein